MKSDRRWRRGSGRGLITRVHEPEIEIWLKTAVGHITPRESYLNRHASRADIWIPVALVAISGAHRDGAPRPELS